MNIKVQISVPQKLPIRKLDSFIDKTVHNIAKITLDRTQPHVPYKSGTMFRDIMSHGVRGGNKTYILGFANVKYTPYVWRMPQKTNWTNLQSYSQWFITEFRKEKESITRQAVGQSMKVLR